MLCGVLIKLLKRRCMAAAAQLRFHLALLVLDIRRAVGLMTLETIRIGHFFRMPLMAVQAAIRLSVFSMTFHTVHVRMHTRVLFHLFAGTGMAGKTYRLNW